MDREHLLALVQTDAELSEILMRAFILRRAELIARGLGDVIVIGSGAGGPFDAGKGSPLAEWIVLGDADQATWLALAREAAGFVRRA